MTTKTQTSSLNAFTSLFLGACLVLAVLACILLPGCSQGENAQSAKSAEVKQLVQNVLEKEIPAKTKAALTKLTDENGKLYVAKLQLVADTVRKITAEYIEAKESKADDKLSGLVDKYVEAAWAASLAQEDLNTYAGKEVSELNELFGQLSYVGAYEENFSAIQSKTEAVTKILGPIEPATLAADSVIAVTVAGFESKLRAGKAIDSETVKGLKQEAARQVLEAEYQALQAEKADAKKKREAASPAAKPKTK